MNNSFSALCVKCHTYNPSVATLDNAGIGSHFVYFDNGTKHTTANMNPEMLVEWVGTGGLSKYGNLADNTSITGARGEMICESCHSMRKNTGVSKLLTNDNEIVGRSNLCEGCHGNTGAGHHPVNGELSSVYDRPISRTGSSVKNPPTAGSEATYTADPYVVNCRSCHKVHDAQGQTGARILKRGYKTVSTPGDPVKGNGGASGLERQSDMAPRLVTDFTPLCDSCHTASD